MISALSSRTAGRTDTFIERLARSILQHRAKCPRYAPAKSPAPTIDDIIEHWLAECRENTKASTCSTYATITERHILPCFASRPVSEISYEEINCLLRDKIERDRLSPATVRGVVTVLRSVFRHAAEKGLDVVSWERIRRPKSQSAQTRILTECEQRQLREYLCRNLDSEKLGVMICMYTGVRIGEICAMKWGDISFDAGILTIRRTVQRIKNTDYSSGNGESKTKIIFSFPKSRDSSRIIPLPPFLMDIMRNFHCSCECFLLTGSEDVFLEPRALQNHFKSMLAEAGVAPVNFHTLRHTFATNCINLGFDPKTLSEILGHADISTTLNTYVHPSFALKQECMSRLV